MCTKTEEKILIASKPFIKKSAARQLLGINYKDFLAIWDQVCNDYMTIKKVPMLPLGLPTTFFLEQIGLSVDQLVQLAEYEKRFSE